MTQSDIRWLSETIGRALSTVGVRSEHTVADYFSAFEDGAKKAGDVLNQLQLTAQQHGKDLTHARIGYVSIGGANGAELAAAMQDSRIVRAILAEYNPDVVHEFPDNLGDTISQAQRKRLRKQRADRHLYILTGDTWSNATQINETLRRWFEHSEIDIAVFSIQSVLHELPTRTNTPGYKHSVYLSRLFEELPTLLLICREPTRDPEWGQNVDLLVGDAELAASVKELADELSRRYFHRDTIVNRHDLSLRMDGPLALETIKKVVYCIGVNPEVAGPKLRYEIGECHDAFDWSAFVTQCKGLFPENEVKIRRCDSEHFRNLWQRSCFIAKNVETQKQLPSPQTFIELVGLRGSLPVLSPSSDVTPTPTKRTAPRAKANISKVVDLSRLEGYWDLFNWPVPKESPSVQGLTATGYLGLVQESETTWAGIMSHTFDLPDLWERPASRVGEPPFIAWYEVSFELTDGVLGGNSRLIRKRYLDPEVEKQRVRSYQHRGIFSRCFLISERGVTQLRGSFETSRKTGIVRFAYTARRPWDAVSDDMIRTIPFELSSRPVLQRLANKQSSADAKTESDIPRIVRLTRTKPAQRLFLVGLQVFPGDMKGSNAPVYTAGAYQVSTNANTNHLPLSVNGMPTMGLVMPLKIGENLISFAAQTGYPIEIVAINLFFSDIPEPYNPTVDDQPSPGHLTVFAQCGEKDFSVPLAGTKIQAYNTSGWVIKEAFSNGLRKFTLGNLEVSIKGLTVFNQPAGQVNLEVNEIEAD